MLSFAALRSFSVFLAGISQRDITGFFPALLDEMEGFKALIVAFFEAHIQQCATLCSCAVNEGTCGREGEGGKVERV